jgi:hypothetical protein
MSETLVILRSARDAWRDVLNGDMTHEGLPVGPYLPRWSRRFPDYCTVCLAGSYYFQRHGIMLTDSTATEIELALDAIRRGRSLAQLNSQSIPGAAHLMDEVLSVWPIGKFEYISSDFKGERKLLELLNMLIDILQTKQLQLVETRQTQTVKTL